MFFSVFAVALLAEGVDRNYNGKAWVAMTGVSPTGLPAGFLGHIWLSAAALLVAGSWLGLRLAARWLTRLPDRWHARIYPLLLIAVLLVMSLQG